MVRLRLTYQCFNGENKTKSLKVASEIYKDSPVSLEFRLPDGTTYSPDTLRLDDNGKVEYFLPREVLYQTGTALAQATVSLSNGKVEKSSIISFPIVQSINAGDDYTILLKNNRLYPYGGNKINCVGDNSKYELKFEGIEELGTVFAVFRRDGKSESPILLNEKGCATIPSWVLKEGSFEVGLKAEGFASAPLSISVERSIVEKLDIISEQEMPIVDQLLEKINDIKYIKSCKIINKELVIVLNDGSEINAGKIVSEGDIVHADQEQNEEGQPDYIKNRTHWKETDAEGKTTFHTLANEYLNLDNEIKEGSSNPVTAGAVFEAIKNMPVLAMYTGEYTVTPNFDEDIVLETQGKAMKDNITIKKIPQFEVPNEAGGKTLFLGDENYGG